MWDVVFGCYTSLFGSFGWALISEGYCLVNVENQKSYEMRGARQEGQGKGKMREEKLTVVGRAEMRRVDCSRKDCAVGKYGIVAV